MSTMFRDIDSVDAMPSHIEAPSRIFGLSAGKTTFRPGLLSQDTSRLNMQFGSSNNVDYMSDQRHRTSVVRSTTVGMRSFGLQSRNLTSHSTMIPGGSFRLNQEIQQRSNNTSSISKPFWPAVRNTTLTTGLQVQDSVRYNDDMIDSDGFRRPTAMSVIRGRNSTWSSRLFHNSDRHYRDLSNINGFNVSHISRRDVDTMSESRLPLGLRSSWMENQSLSGSVISGVSMKAQFMNLLENLHHSILSIGPHVTADAVRMEFDKAKQGLENISEMSFAPTIKPADTVSVVSHSSKSICPLINGDPVPVSSTLDGGSLHLKSSKDLLKTLISSKNNYRRKLKLSTHAEEGEGKEGAAMTPSVGGQGKESEGEDDSSCLVFKKPRPCVPRRKTPRMKIKAPPVVKNLLPKGVVNKVINLKQWYPIAVGSDLAFCGVDEKGASVKTDAVKKRLSNRKVELVTGLDCNLIGSPSTMISVLPQKIVTLLRNGLTDRWRVLQKELLNCQTAEAETRRRKSMSPGEKATETPARGRPAKKGKPGKPRIVSTPKKKSRELHTRSGRSVKQPGMFWLANGSNEVSSSLQLSETTVQDPPIKRGRKSNERSPAKKSKISGSASPSKKYNKTSEGSPNKKPKSSPKIPKKEQEGSPSRKEKVASSPAKTKAGGKEAESSPKKSKPKKGKEGSPIKKYKRAKVASPKKQNEESPRKKYKRSNKGSPGRRVASPAKDKRGDAESSPKKSRRKPAKVKSPKEKKRKESEEEVKVHSSTEEAKQQNKSRGKRKRDVVADADSVEAKKSKMEKETEVEVESTVKSTEPANRGRKKTKIGLSVVANTPKPKGKKSPQAKNKKQTGRKKTVKTAAESQNETTEFTEFEKNFEFKLDDIEIPEIANVSGNPQLSRSQLRLVSMETPPLKYFNSNLKLMGSTTPMRSPDWCISQRTESEVKQFQRRREEAFKKKIKVDIKKTVVKEKNGQNKDVKRVMEWVAEKTVRSPQWSSKVLQYVIPSRKQMEEQDDEDVDTDFF